MTAHGTDRVRRTYRCGRHSRLMTARGNDAELRTTERCGPPTITDPTERKARA